MCTPAWLDQMNLAFGFHEDEGARQVHGDAMRTASIAMAVATVPFGVFQEYALEQRGAVGHTRDLIASLGVLGMCRVQLNGFGAADERLTRARQSVFAWPCITLEMVS